MRLGAWRWRCAWRGRKGMRLYTHCDVGGYGRVGPPADGADLQGSADDVDTRMACISRALFELLL
jgi:hypothetical protein